jgi:lipoprotein-releasing system ATP-binding protein
MNALEAKNINKYFRTPTLFQVLKEVSFTIESGEFVSIMGKSGCGKSTLLYILSTMDSDYEGDLYLSGEKLTGQTPDELAIVRNKHIGFIFQFHYLLPEFSVLENVMLPAMKLGLKSNEEIEHDAMQILRKLDVHEQARKVASKISGGQKQRIAIARSLINNPTIIMGDEPTGNLDSKNSANVFSILKELSQESNLSLLVVTHDHDFAAKTDRIITMEDGTVIDHGR